MFSLSEVDHSQYSTYHFLQIMNVLPSNFRQIRCCAIFLILVLLQSACSEITLPRLEWGDEKKDPSVALRVNLELDSSVQQAAIPYRDACGNEKAYQIGNQLSQMLLVDSQQVFQDVVSPQDPTYGQLADAVLQYTVLERKYDLTIPRLESDAEYPAKAFIRIRALLKEIGTGKELYAETFKGQGRWQVSSDEDGQDCEPIGVGIPINSALESISDKLVDTMRDSGRLQIAASQISDQRRQLSRGVSQASVSLAPIAAPTTESQNPSSSSSGSLSSSRFADKPSVQFRTKLVDANRNLVLEGGEALKLLLEIQNVSDSTIPSAYVEMRGTPVLVEAFKQVVSLPVPLGSLKAGEKRTAEIRGRLPLVKKKNSGELMVGIILSEGRPPGSHSILAEIVPRATSHK